LQQKQTNCAQPSGKPRTALAKAIAFVITRATKSQKFSAFLKVYETSTNQISRWYHEPFQSY